MRSLAYDAALFDKATSLIATLAKGRMPTNNVNDAINVFTSLFYLYLSGTHAPASQRANLLIKMAVSNKDHSNELVLSGLDAMLKCTHFSSYNNFDFGTRRRDYGYNPKTGDETREWYREVFKLSGNLAGHKTLCDPIRNLIASQFRSLSSRTGSTDTLIALAHLFANDGGWPEGWAGVRAATRDATKAERKDDAVKLQALADLLKPTGLAERISSHVLPEQWGALDIAEIDFEDDKRYEKAQKLVEKVCEGIGNELSNDLSAFKSHLPKMLKSGSMRVDKVALSIGRMTKRPIVFWDTLISEVTDTTYSGQVFNFPASFLLGLSEVNKPLSEELLDGALLNPLLHPSFIQMQARVGINSFGRKRIVDSTRLPSIPTHTFSMLGHGRVSDNLSAQEFKEMVTSIAARDGGVEIALDILYMRIFSKRKDQKTIEDAERETGRVLLGLVTFEKRQDKEIRSITKIVQECLVSPKDDVLVEALCERLLYGLSQWKISAIDYGQLVAEIGRIYPRVLLDILVERASNEFDSKLSIWKAFRENNLCPIEAIPDDILLEWANEHPESRFCQIAEVLRPWKKPNKENSNDNYSDEDISSGHWTRMALKILHEAPEPLDVLSQYIKNFRPNGWSGSLASILKSREPLLEQLTQDENTSIAEAADQELATLKEEVILVQKREEAYSRKRDERFEW